MVLELGFLTAMVHPPASHIRELDAAWQTQDALQPAHA